MLARGMWKRKGKAEWLPWYRARNYRGDLTEAEKRQLDALRTQSKHPAATSDDLPEEVQDYISRIELELYDHKQEAAFGKAFFWSAVGAVLLFLNYEGVIGEPTFWIYAAGALVVILPWFLYRHEWKKNAEEFFPEGRPYGNPTDEAIRQEWELRYIGRLRGEERDASSDELDC